MTIETNRKKPYSGSPNVMVKSSRGSLLCKRLVAVVVAHVTFAAVAGNYDLPTGQTDTISSLKTYDAMTVAGDLTVTGSGDVSVMNLNLTGGTVTVAGEEARIGAASSGAEDKTTVHLSQGEQGKYGRVNVDGASESLDYSFCACQFYIDKENDVTYYPEGYVDFACISNGGFHARQIFNNSSLTGRLTVAGTAVSICRAQKRVAGSVFDTGAFRIEMKDGVVFTFDVQGQGGYFNKVGTPVEVVGEGTFYAKGTYSSSNYPCSFNAGAILNHRGPIALGKYQAKTGSLFKFTDDNVIGPNVTGLSTTGDCNDGVETIVQIEEGVALTLCGDIDITKKGDRLTGGKLRIDATDDSRSFKAKIGAGDAFVLEKIGESELVVSSTPVIPHLHIADGIVRITEDCEIGDIVSSADAANPAKLVADGCVVTIAGEHSLETLRFEAINGGCFKTAGSVRLYGDANTVPQSVHASGGTLSFSKVGIPGPYWRLTMKKMKTGTGVSSLHRFYGFGADGSCVTMGIQNDSPQIWTNGVERAAVQVGRARWMIDASQTLSYTKESSWLRNIEKIFVTDANSNHYPQLGAPNVDEADPRTYLSVEFCTEEAKRSPMTGYTIFTTTKGSGNYLTTWDLSTSTDGRNWSVVDTRENVTKPIDAAVYTDYAGIGYDDGIKGKTPIRKDWEYFTFSNYQTPGVQPSEKPIAVQADNDGVVDLTAFAEPQEIDTILIDMGNGSGTIRKGRLAKSGVVKVMTEAEFRSGTVLPLVLENVEDVANIENWSIFLNGKLVRKTVKCDAASGQLTVFGPGLMLLFR